MISFSPARPILAAAALAAALLCASCAGETMSVSAGDCWGNGSGDCRAAQGRVLRALGYQGTGLSALASDLTCGTVVDCSAVAKVTRARPAQRSSSARSAPSREANSAEPRAQAEPAAENAVQAEPQAESLGQVEPAVDSEAAATEAPVVTPRAPATEDAAGAQQVAAAPPTANVAAQQNTEKLAAASGSTGSCSGIDIASLEHKGTLSGADKGCLMDAASGKVGASGPEIQIAVITLYNQKIPGWQKAVETALSRKNLANAPNLNLAGIKPAYDGKKYGTVIKRSDVVWRNLKKGYALSGEQRTFLAEFACRSALQLHLMQKPNSRGFDWCERWRSRLTKSGGSTAEVDDILDQLED